MSKNVLKIFRSFKQKNKNKNKEVFNIRIYNKYYNSCKMLSL